MDFNEKINVSLIVIASLFLVVLTDNLRSTGFAVVMSPQSNFTLGLGLWIVLNLLVGAWGYLKLRRYNRKNS